MENKKILVDGQEFWGHESKLGEKSLVYIKGRSGYIMCGYLNKEAADNFSDIAATVSGVSKVEDILDKELNWVSKKAADLGIAVGMKAKETLKLI